MTAYDALYLFGWLLLLGVGIGWCVSTGIDWLIRRIKHD